MAKYVQINTFPDRSTGNVMLRIQDERRSAGDECWIMWGRGRDAQNDHEYKTASQFEVYLDAAQTRLFGRPGFHSKAATKRLLEKLEEIDPDVVHLHNLHGYYLNVQMLFEWLACHRCQVFWTLHDCWAFTGHCAYFTYVGCNQWLSGCATGELCPQLDTYPKTSSRSSCKWSYEHKRRLFTMLPSDRLTIITPSQWLCELVEKSFLSKYAVQIHHNMIDTSIFKVTPSDFREVNEIGERIMVLGVASEWTSRKGIDDFRKLAKDLDHNRFVVVMVGVTAEQASSLPQCVIPIERTDSLADLARIYTAADVLFNPTKEDNFPTVNLEAEACGTMVVAYDSGGSGETIKQPFSKLVAGYEAAIEEIQNIATAK